MSKIVALEVSPQAIRGTEVSGFLSKKPKILRVGEIKLEENVAGESLVINDEAFVAALKELWSTAKFSTKAVALVVGGRRFIVRSHSTTHNSMQTVRSTLAYEGQQALPEQSESLIYDFYPTHEVETKVGTKTEGLVVSTPAEPINRIVMGLKQAKFELEYVDFAPLAVTRWILRNRPEKTYALVNIREESTDIAIAEDAMPRMIRVVSKGLNNKRRPVRETPVESQLLRRDVLGDQGVNLLMQDISLTIRTQSDSVDEELECIFTSGPRADDSELIKRMEEIFGIPVIPLAIEEPIINPKQAADKLSTDNEEGVEVNKAVDSSIFNNFVTMTGGMR